MKSGAITMNTVSIGSTNANVRSEALRGFHSPCQRGNSGSEGEGRDMHASFKVLNMEERGGEREEETLGNSQVCHALRPKPLRTECRWNVE